MELSEETLEAVYQYVAKRMSEDGEKAFKAQMQMLTAQYRAEIAKAGGETDV